MSARRGGEAAIRRGARQEELGPGDLTRRQREILALFCRGLSYTRIAEARGVKSVTIRNAVYAIQGKLERAPNRKWWSGRCATDCWMINAPLWSPEPERRPANRWSQAVRGPAGAKGSCDSVQVIGGLAANVMPLPYLTGACRFHTPPESWALLLRRFASRQVRR